MSEAPLRCGVEVLAGEYEHAVAEKGGMDLLPGRVIEVRQIDVRDDGAARGLIRSDGDGHDSGTPPVICSTDC